MPKKKKQEFTGYTENAQYRCLENLQHMSVTLYLAYCGWEKTEPLQAFGPLERKNHVFHFVLSGKGRFRAAGKEWELTKGDIFYIPPGVSNEYIADENDPWEYVWVGYGGIWAEEFSEAAGFSNDAFVRRTDRSEEISRLILGMLGARSLSMSDALHRESCLLESRKHKTPQTQSCLRNGRPRFGDLSYFVLARIHHFDLPLSITD